MYLVTEELVADCSEEGELLELGAIPVSQTGQVGAMDPFSLKNHFSSNFLVHLLKNVIYRKKVTYYNKNV